MMKLIAAAVLAVLMLGGTAAGQGIGSFSHVTVDNGTGPTIPTVDGDGLMDLMGHLKFFRDGDGDGDYDADIWSKDNMYVAAESGIHLMPNSPGNGRIVLGSDTSTNYLWSGRNYSGTTINGLQIGPFRGTARWMYFEPTNGYIGVGLDPGEAPAARLHIKNTGATNLLIESTESAGARAGFQGTTTASASTVTVGADGNDLVLRAGGVVVLRLRGPMPTSATGLPSKTVYVDANNFLKVVP